MKQIYGFGAIQMVPCQNGIVFVSMQDEHDGKATIVYRMFDCENSTVSAVTRSVFLLNKFGNHFEKFEGNPREFISCKTAILPNSRILVIGSDKKAVIIGSNGEEEWTGEMTFKGNSPSSIAAKDNFVWAAYSNPAAIIRYSVGKGLRQELRIGSGEDLPSGLESIWPDENEKLTVCAVGENKIIKIDPKTYAVSDYHKFSEPVHDYIKINSNEIVLTEKGIFRL